MAKKEDTTTKMRGDAGEYFMLGMITFAGIPCTKMPDNWPAYDIIADKKGTLQKISVKTRTETEMFSQSSYFEFSSSKTYDWGACVLKRKDGSINSWVIPIEFLLKNASKPDGSSKNPNLRRITWRKLMTNQFKKFEDNFILADIVDEL